MAGRKNGKVYLHRMRYTFFFSSSTQRHAVRLLIVATASVLFSCASPQGLHDTVTVGTFNMEWLGDGQGDNKSRNDGDYLKIADVILKTEADVLGIQEVENDQALRKVLRYMEGYDGFVANGGSAQNVGVIFRKGMTVENKGLYMPLAINPSRNRPGLVLACRKGDFDWLMMVVHLKSTSRYDSTNALREESRVVRAQQADVLRAWVDSTLRSGKEADVLIVGDMNDFPARRQQPTLTALTDDSNVTFITSQLKSCKNQNWFVIDHVVASTSAMKRYIKGSERLENFRAFLDAADADIVSDHCPVMVRFSTAGPDND